MSEQATTGAKVHTYSYSFGVVIDAPNEACAEEARAELWRLVDFAASTTNYVSDDMPVTICIGENNDWALVEIRDAYPEDDDDHE